MSGLFGLEAGGLGAGAGATGAGASAFPSSLIGASGLSGPSHLSPAWGAGADATPGFLSQLAGSPLPGMLMGQGAGMQKEAEEQVGVHPMAQSLAAYLNPSFSPSVYGFQYPQMVLSDVNAKKDVKSYAGQGRQLSDREIMNMRTMLNKLEPYSYRYRPESGAGNPYDPNKRYVGIMAQDLERSPLGQTMVENTPHGKVIDVGKGLGAFLAATSDLNQRINALERRKKNG